MPNVFSDTFLAIPLGYINAAEFILRTLKSNSFIVSSVAENVLKGCSLDQVFFRFWDWDWDWDKFIQHNMTLYRCMISYIHDSSYVLFRTNLISNTSLHVGRPLLRPCLVAYAEATLARQKDSATNEKCWHHFRILIVDKWSVVWNECKKSWVPNDRLEKPLIPCNMISN